MPRIPTTLLLMLAACAAPTEPIGEHGSGAVGGKADCVDEDTCTPTGMPLPLELCHHGPIVEGHANHWYVIHASPEAQPELADALRADLAAVGVDGQLAIGWKDEGPGEYAAFVSRDGFTAVYRFDEMHDPIIDWTLVLADTMLTHPEGNWSCEPFGADPDSDL